MKFELKIQYFELKNYMKFELKIIMKNIEKTFEKNLNFYF